MLFKPDHACTDIIPFAHNDAGLFPREVFVKIACVVERHLPDFQGKQLIGFSGVHRFWHHAKLKWIKLCVRIDEAAQLAIELVHIPRLRIVVRQVPTLWWHLGDGTFAVTDVAPVGLKIFGPGKHAGHADDGNLLQAHATCPPASTAVSPRKLAGLPDISTTCASTL